MKIIHTNIFNNLPGIKLHDIVILESSQRDRISIDFIPLHSSFINLLLGKYVVGKIRMFSITNDFVFENISKHFYIENNRQFIPLSNINKIKSSKLKEFVLKIHENSTKYNLYKFNCKHFRRDVETKFHLFNNNL
jgi:hypothetical protein